VNCSLLAFQLVLNRDDAHIDRLQISFAALKDSASVTMHLLTLANLRFLYQKFHSNTRDMAFVEKPRADKSPILTLEQPFLCLKTYNTESN
jgi:hypothetical protein